jgi:transposase
LGYIYYDRVDNTLSGQFVKREVKYEEVKTARKGGNPMTLRLRAVSQEEQQVIEKLSRSQTAPVRLVERAKIIRLASQGKSMPQIAEQLHVGYNMVYKWFKRFTAQGLDGLQDAPRKGAPARYQPEETAQIIAAAKSRPSQVGEPSFESWTFRRLTAHVQEHLGISMKRTRIFELLRAEGLQWRKQETWFPKRVDPDFVAKRGPSNG